MEEWKKTDRQTILSRQLKMTIQDAKEQGDAWPVLKRQDVLGRAYHRRVRRTTWETITGADIYSTVPSLRVMHGPVKVPGA